MSEVPSRRLERRTRQRATNRAAILEAARRIAAQQGTGNLSLRSVAAEAGYAPASVYEYFQNRAELVIALATEDLAALTRELRDTRDQRSFESAAAVTLNFLRMSGALPAAISSLGHSETPSETQRVFNGKLIAALTAFAETSGLTPANDPRRQAEIIVAVASLIGLAVLSRAGRLSALSLDEQALIGTLASLYSQQRPNIS